MLVHGHQGPQISVCVKFHQCCSDALAVISDSNMARARSVRLPPAEDQRLIRDTYRWPERARLMMTSSVLSVLSWEEMRDIQRGAPLPSDQARMSRVYDTLHVKLCEFTTAEAAAAAVPAGTLPTRRAVKEAAKRWTLSLLRTGDLHDTPPHQPGYRLAGNAAALTEIHALLLAGWQDSLDQTCIFRDLRDLEQRKPAEFGPLFASTGLQTLDGVWGQLTKMFPKLGYVVRRTKKLRDSKEVQACARQALGLDPVQFPKMYAKDPALMALPNIRDAHEPGYEYYWSPDHYKNCWFCDALTIDPSELLADDKGIWERGTPQPVCQRRLENANIGSLPKILLYLAVHPDHGAHIFYPYHGAKHGGSADTKFDEGKMYNGFEFWYTQLTPAELEHVRSRCYYVQASGVRKMSATTRARMAAPGFNPQNFLVSSPYNLML